VIRAIAILAVCAYGQKFEVASVKPSKAESNASSGIQTGHGRLAGRNVTLKRCIIGAYGVGPHQILGGPYWLDSDRFEILAKADEPIDDDTALMVMLRDVLADRFKLVIHRETKTIPALVMELAKNGPKFEKSSGGEAVTNTSGNQYGVSIDARNTDMDAFAAILARSMDLPVVNRTGLQGVFNIKLQWMSENAKRTEGPSIFTAIQEQLGLRLRSEKTPVEILVIDHAEKPSEN